jgi:hypothetical protein
MYMQGGMPVLSLAHVAGDLIVAGMLDGTLFFVDRPLTKEIREFRELKHPIGTLATDSTRNILAASDARGYTIVWNVSKWRQYGPFYEDDDGQAVIDPQDSSQLILRVRDRGLCRVKIP